MIVHNPARANEPSLGILSHVIEAVMLAHILLEKTHASEFYVSLLRRRLVMIRKLLIIVMTLWVILPASSVCALVRDCGGTDHSAVMSESCPGSPGHTMTNGTLSTTLSTSDECCCPSITPNGARQAVVIISTPPVNGQHTAFAWLVQRTEENLQQPASRHSRQRVAFPAVPPPKLYRLYSSYLI